MHPIEIVTLIMNFISLSICGGLVFSALISTNQDELNRLFAAVCGSFAFWASMSLLRHIGFAMSYENIGFTQFVLNLMMSAVFVSGALYFIFMVRYAEVRGPLIDLMSIVIGLVTLVGVISLWIGQIFQVTPQAIGYYTVSEIGFILFGLTLGYMMVAFWLMLNATTEKSMILRRPTFVLFFAYAVTSLNIWGDMMGLDIFIVSFVVGWFGLKILRRQVTNPQSALNRDLQLSNNELQRMIYDLAQEKEKTEALNVELIRANRYKDEFLATMSHELLTPLNSIIGYSELLMTNMYGELGEKQSDRLQRIYKNGLHLTGVIHAILDLNKIDSGRMLLVIEDFDLIELIQEIQSEFRPQADEKSIEFSLDMPEDMPFYHGDRKRITQVLRIIVDNAVKFTAEGQIQIRLLDVIVAKGKSETFSLPTIGWLKDGHWAIIEIADTGIGIDPRDQARIFDRFSQADSSRTREFDGIGLGLTIARKLVELHDGMVWVKSQVEQGSKFYVALPYRTMTDSMHNK